MIRSNTPNDTISLIAIAEESGLFQPNQLDEIGGLRSDPTAQERGTELLRYVEQTVLGVRGARVLLVETSGLPLFERTRAFYCKCGYEEEARIRDFYKAGDDKIVYRKALLKESITAFTAVMRYSSSN